MKRLTTYLNEKLFVNQQFDEKLIINKNYNPYTCAPKSWKELREIIEDRYDKLGPGTEQNPIDFNDVDISNVNTFYNEDKGIGIFQGTKFKYIDISNWNVSNVENMNCMFYECKQLESIGDLSEWNVSNAENMWGMFGDCKQLKFIGDLSNWDVSNVKDMNWMFSGSAITNTPGWHKF